MNLAFRMRPTSLRDFVGQEHLIGEGKIISQMIQQKKLFSMLLWGPPGTGKTTLAMIIARETEADFHSLSAVSTGKEDLKKIIQYAKENNQIGRRTVLF